MTLLIAKSPEGRLLQTAQVLKTFFGFGDEAAGMIPIPGLNHVQYLLYFEKLLVFDSKVTNPVKLIEGRCALCDFVQAVYQHWLNLTFP